jgi:ATP-binding cassette subfamily B protein
VHLRKRTESRIVDRTSKAAAKRVSEVPGLGRGASLRRLPMLTGRAVQLVWRAARGELLIHVGLQVVAGAGVAVQLLLARRILTVVLDGPAGSRSLGDVAPELTALGVVTALLGFVAAIVAERRLVLTEQVERHVQGRIVDAVSTVELSAFDDAEFHDRLRRARVNAAGRSWSVTYALVSLASGVAGMVALGGVLMGIEPLVLPVVALSYFPLWLATSRNSRSSYGFAYATTPADRERVYVGDVLTGKAEAKEVRLFGLAGFLRRRYDELYERRFVALRQLVARRLRRGLLANGGNAAISIGGLCLLIQFVLSGRISPSGAGVAAVALQQLGSRLRALDASAGSLQECSLFLEDLLAFLDMAPPADAPSPEPAVEPFHRLAVEHVTFRYPGTSRAVLSDVSLEIGRGEVVALVGRNGSGKSTLAKLLCGLYAPTSGRITRDGVDVADIDAATLRRGITAIFQDFARYELTAAENVGLGDIGHGADLPAIRAAAATAGVDDLLAGLPEGYETRLGRTFEHGSELSIGQWQRVALARAFYRDAPFLVLDEPTAALDARSEHDLLERIHHLQRGRTVLLISHRFSSVRSADRIYVLDGGAVVEEGTHAELLRRRGHYAEMFTLQASAYLDERDPA